MKRFSDERNIDTVTTNSSVPMKRQGESRVLRTIDWHYVTFLWHRPDGDPSGSYRSKRCHSRL